MIKRIIRKIRRHLFPTTQDRWRAVRGDQTLRLDYPLKPDSLILDFGGFEGEWAKQIYDRYQCKIVVFEPVAQFAEKIRLRFVGNEKIEVCNFGLGKDDREEKIYLSEDGSSTFSNEGASEAIVIKDAIGWLNERGRPDIALAKINIEGGEYELLERLAEDGYIQNINYLQIQFHGNAPDAIARMEAIQRSLELTHNLEWQYYMVWEGWSRKKL